MTETQADTLIEQCNDNLAKLVANLSGDQLKSVLNAKNAILESIAQHGDDGWVGLSMILADMNVEED